MERLIAKMGGCLAAFLIAMGAAQLAFADPVMCHLEFRLKTQQDPPPPDPDGWPGNTEGWFYHSHSCVGECIVGFCTEIFGEEVHDVTFGDVIPTECACWADANFNGVVDEGETTFAGMPTCRGFTYRDPIDESVKIALCKPTGCPGGQECLTHASVHEGVDEGFHVWKMECECGPYGGP
jgi:hypothetical protein